MTPTRQLRPNDAWPYVRDDNSVQIKIEVHRRRRPEVPVYRHLVAYKPIGLTDYSCSLPTPATRAAHQARLRPLVGHGLQRHRQLRRLSRAVGSTGPSRSTAVFSSGANTGATPPGPARSSPSHLQPTWPVPECPALNSLTIGGGYPRRHDQASDGITEPQPANLTLRSSGAALMVPCPPPPSCSPAAPHSTP